MADAPTVTPFDMVLTELWNMLLSHPRFVRDVRERNRIRFDSLQDRDPLKQTVAAADLPEVTIIPQTVSANLQSTSSTSMCTRQYSVLVTTGDLRYNVILGNIEWYVFCAMLSWRTRLTGLLWKGQHFCKRLNIVSARSGIDNTQQNKGLMGWSAVWQIEVEMHFNTNDLLAELEAGEVGIS